MASVLADSFQLMLLAPFFFASWLSEYYVARRFFPDTAPARLKQGMFAVSLASYALLLTGLAYLFITIPFGWPPYFLRN